MKIITAGQKYADIDTLACGVAYKELLEKRGESVEFVIPGALNASITKEIKKWNLDYIKQPTFNAENTDTIIVDLSNPKYFANFVKKERVITVFDHHFGFDEYWLDKISEQAKIEKVGACATLIWEEYKKYKLNNTISALSANLIYTAILSNTLNLKSATTDQRDIEAMSELKPYTKLPDSWTKNYFSSVSRAIWNNPENSMQNDTKQLEHNGKKYAIIQIELWDSMKFLIENKKIITNLLKKFNVDYAFYTSPSISEGKNYFLVTNSETKDKLRNLLGVKFNKGVGSLNKLIMRKEIIREILK